MTDPGLNELLRWGVENSETLRSDPTSQVNHEEAQAAEAPRGPSNAALSALFGGPSEADLMRDAMTTILSAESALYNKIVAFDNLEQLLENIDNSNNLAPLGMWPPLIDLLKNEEAQLRAMAAWCSGTAVQNNPKAQGILRDSGAIPTLVKMAVEDENLTARKKGILALSSAIRNNQSSLDIALGELPDKFCPDGKVLDAANMDQIDNVIQTLRDSLKK